MKTMSSALEAHYASGSTTLATCWRATLTNGTIVAATTHREDLEIDGVTYLSLAGYTPSDISNSSDLSVDNLDVEGILASPAITTADIHSGVWDYAAVEIFEVNAKDLTMGKNILRTGTLGQVTGKLTKFVAELRGLTQKYSRKIVKLTTKTCTADLGDAKCKIHIADFVVAGRVNTVTLNRTFTDPTLVAVDNWYTGGLVTFTSGFNTGLSMEVKNFAGTSFTLQEQMPFSIAIGDTFTVYPGCMKEYERDCIAKWNNGINFRGFPHLPGNSIYNGPLSGPINGPGTVPTDPGSVPIPTPAPTPAPAPAPTTPPPSTVGTFPLVYAPNTYFQIGQDTAAYWVHDNTWGAGSIAFGSNPDQFEQYVGVDPAVGAGGEVSFEIKWRWPSPPGSTEVKGYPEILRGAKPGDFNTGTTPGGNNVRLLDGTDATVSPCGATPGTIFPIQLPIPSLHTDLAWSHLDPATGSGHLSFDIWLQSAPGQDHGFGSSSITHEIMIPVDNWGGYGSYPGGRNPEWYDHDVVIGGNLFHVYAAKTSDGRLLYNFGGLDNTYGRTGWKFIVFEPDVLPLPVSSINIADFINYLHTVTDSADTPWTVGNEYLVDVEFGVEPHEGTGHLLITDYKVYT